MKMTMATLLILMSFTQTSAFAADKSKKKMPIVLTPEQRQSMATTHEKMATCLRSEKAMEECHKEMMQSCQETMGKDGCPMMGKMGSMDKMKGKMKAMGNGMKHMMDDPESEKQNP